MIDLPHSGGLSESIAIILMAVLGTFLRLKRKKVTTSDEEFDNDRTDVRPKGPGED